VNIRRILVLRFSAMGDVALTLPVLQSLKSNFPEIEITLITRPKFSAIFDQSGIKIFEADLEQNYSGVAGLQRLFRSLLKLKPDVIFDLHDNLRSRILGFMFRLFGIPVYIFEKGRQGKHKATGADRIHHRNQLLHTTERYLKVFKRAGLEFEIPNPPFIRINESKITILSKLNLDLNNRLRFIGVAPFAAHKTKIWPIEKFKILFEDFHTDDSIQFLLFGGGDSEIEQFKKIEQEYHNTKCVAGILSLKEELELIACLDAMICVDSSNMHLASLCGVPILSIWGGTHILTGFGPMPNKRNRIVEIGLDELPCRPCSVYGKSNCLRGDFACMEQITPKKTGAVLREMLLLNN
jgi:ADP-heptose:LPS heptosyltransferase